MTAILNNVIQTTLKLKFLQTSKLLQAKFSKDYGEVTIKETGFAEFGSKHQTGYC